MGDDTTVNGTELVSATGTRTATPTAVIRAPATARGLRYQVVPPATARWRLSAPATMVPHRSSEMAISSATPKVTITPKRMGRMSDTSGRWANARHGSHHGCPRLEAPPARFPSEVPNENTQAITALMTRVQARRHRYQVTTDTATKASSGTPK
jgi:hypothetical protein